MTKTYDFPIRLPDKNSYTNANRTNKYAGNGVKKKTEQDLVLLMRSQGIVKFEKQVRFHAEWYDKNKRRDPSNIAAAKDFILDAMQTAGVLRNDGWKEIKGFKDDFFISKEEGYPCDYGVIVTLKEVD